MPNHPPQTELGDTENVTAEAQDTGHGAPMPRASGGATALPLMPGQTLGAASPFGGAATPQRPLLGLTMLIVEDSRFACEAMRLLCLRSGARLRRADCLSAAERHLRVYRPDVLIVDLGLPDGPGERLIQHWAQRRNRPAVILGTSGDTTLGPAALAAGAQGFLEKPVASLRDFQLLVLESLNEAGAERPEPAPLDPAEDALSPDPIALRDDLAHAAELLSADPDRGAREYLSKFLTGLARSADDRELATAAQNLSTREADGGKTDALRQLSLLVRQRLIDDRPLGQIGRRSGAGRASTAARGDRSLGARI